MAAEPNQQIPVEEHPGDPPAQPRQVPVHDIYPDVPGSPAPPKPTEGAGPPPQGPPSPPQQPKSRRKNWRDMASIALLLLLAPLIAWSISTFALQSYQVDGQSMETTLQDQDRLIVNKIPRTLARLTHHSYIPNRGDIIIFNTNSLLEAFGGQKQLIKRVIGLPGERVVIKKGKITVYNAEHPKGFDPDSSGLYRISAKTTNHDVDVKLKADEIFVCGDNRPNSEDSRFFGPIKADDVVGRLSLRIMPFNKFQRY